MLTSLLPGLRDLRAPLAAGYLWLLFAWLLLHDRIEEWRADDEGIAADLLSTVDGLGPGGRVVAVSFLAYVIGSLALTGIEDILRRRSGGTRTVERWHRASAAEMEALAGQGALGPTTSWNAEDGSSEDENLPEWRYLDLYVSSSLFPTDAFEPIVRTWAIDMKGALERAGEPDGRLWELVALELFGRRELRRELRLPERSSNRRDPPQVLASDNSPAGPGDAGHLLAQVTARIADEHELIAYSLMDEKSDFFEPIDRRRAEIELRTAIALPIAALVLLLTVTASPVWLLAAAVPVGLIYQTRMLTQQRIELITAALTTKRIRSPSLNRLEAAVIAIAEAPRHPAEPAGAGVRHD
jgi:hypothetical protein